MSFTEPEARARTGLLTLLASLGVIVLIVGLAQTACSYPSDQSGVNGELEPLFRTVAAERTGIEFANILRPSERLSIISYLYYFNGGGVAAGDVDGDGLVDLFFTANQGANALYLNRGGLRFEDVTAASGIGRDTAWSTGASFVDIDGDGDLDLYVCNVSGIAGLKGRNRLYINDGTGSFEESARRYGLDLAGLNTQAGFFDADGDGDLDVYITRHSVHDAARYVDTSSRSNRDTLSADMLLLRAPDGAYERAPSNGGVRDSRLGYGLGLAIGDLDLDGRPDIYVGNDFSEEDYAYQNLGGGSFRARRWMPHTSQFSMGNVIADLNADGRLDVVSVDMRPWADSLRKSSSNADELNNVRSRQRRGFGRQYARNAVQLNLPGGFADAAPMLGVHSTDWSWSPVVFDADLDGQPDFVVGNGIVRRPNDLDYLKYSSGRAVQGGATDLQLAGLMPPGLTPDRAFRGVANAPFEDVTTLWGLDGASATTGLIAVDLDNDGDEDLVGNRIDAPVAVYENTAAELREGTGLVVRVELVDERGTPAVGAAMVVEQGGRRRAFSFSPVSGFQSSVVAPIPVWVGDSDDAIAITVVWPYGETIRYSVSLEGDAGPVTELRLSPRGEGGVDTSIAFRIREYAGAEPSYAGFEIDPLLPLLSDPEGKGCVDRESVMPDTEIRIGTGSGSEFVARGCTTQPADWSLALCSTISPGQPSCKRLPPGDLVSKLLELRTGRGGHPVILALARESRAGLLASPVSRAFQVLNGEPTPVSLPLDGAFGQVTDAVVLDDSTALVAALWQPVRLLQVRSARSGTELTVTVDSVGPSGLWTQIVPVRRGAETAAQRFILSNLGLNTLLTESLDEKAELHVADFDRNGRPEPISVRVGADGVRRTLLGLDPIASQMPDLRRFFRSYLPFSASSYDEMFPPIGLAEGKIFRADELRSAVFTPATRRFDYLSFWAQIGTPVSATIDSAEMWYIDYASPATRPELSADVFTTLAIKPMPTW